MTNSIGTGGLIVDTAAEVTSDLTTGLQNIYGSDINVDQNAPDGQLIGIFTQTIIDLLELLVQINNSFDPDQASGVILDQRVAINYIARQGGTYTIQPIDIVVSATVTLQGLDSDFSDPNGTGYTVQDNSGNLFILQNTVTLTAGTHTVDFRAQQIGFVNVPIDTITNPVTIVLGVTSVNNSSAAITIGENQETDPQLRTRRQQSVALATTGYANGLLGAILNLAGVTEAALYQNRTRTTDGNGTPGNCIWLVVAGGASSDIANQLYNRVSDGCNMRGSVTYTITTPSGTPFIAQWDTPTAEPLYIRFSIQPTVTGASFDTTTLAAAIAAALTYSIGAFAETSAPTAAAVAAIAANGGGGVPVLMQISSDDSTWTDYLNPSTLASQFTIAAEDIAITVI